jgi:hypothetical protein
LCDPESAAEYVGRKLLSKETFAQARKEYQRATANYAPPYHASFTLRKPNERALLEIWHIGYGPNVSYGLCVTDPNLYWSDPAERRPLIVRYGFPPGEQIECPGLVPGEGSISRAAFDELLEPLKHLQVPPYPGEEAFVCDGALYGFEVVLGSTRFSYQWHTVPPKGWEPVAQWLYNAVRQLRSLTGTPTS